MEEEKCEKINKQIKKNIYIKLNELLYMLLSTNFKFSFFFYVKIQIIKNI